MLSNYYSERGYRPSPLQRINMTFLVFMICLVAQIQAACTTATAVMKKTEQTTSTLPNLGGTHTLTTDLANLLFTTGSECTTTMTCSLKTTDCSTSLTTPVTTVSNIVTLTGSGNNYVLTQSKAFPSGYSY